MRAVRLGEYRHLYELRRPSRRLDWFVAISHTISTDRGSVPWSDVIVPNENLGIRASRAAPAMTTHGLGYPQLRSRKQRDEPRALLQPVLEEFLANSGWDTTEAAIRDTLDALDTPVWQHAQLLLEKFNVRDAPDASA
jgi:hypothetical protein